MIKTLFAAGALSVLMVGGAAAADLIIEPPAVDDPVVSNWDGLYAGLTGALWLEGGVVFPALGVELGGNFVSGDLLLGAEIDLAYYLTSGNFDVGVTGRAGAVLDSAVIYGSLGIATLSNGSAYVPVGAGVEFMVTDSMSIDLQGEYLIGLNGFNAVRASTSLNFHF